jgi:hypothetical protein
LSKPFRVPGAAGVTTGAFPQQTPGSLLRLAPKNGINIHKMNIYTL